MEADRKFSPWFQAVMVRPPCICGLQMRPYSIGHELILSELGNPYASGGIPTKVDLLFALQVCARRTDKVREWLMAGGLRTRRMAWWAYRCGRGDMADAEAAFRTYWADYNNLPALCNASGKRLNASPQWHMAGILMQHCDALCRQYGNVWDVPKPIAICAVDAWAERNGGADIATNDEKEMLKLARDMKALLAAGHNDQAAKLMERIQTMAATQRAARGGAQ